MATEITQQHTEHTVHSGEKATLYSPSEGILGRGRGKKSSSWVEGQSPSREHLKGEALLIQSINFSKRRKYIKELLCK